MNDAPILVYYDFVDPISWLLQQRISTMPEEVQARCVWCGFEIRPPPSPLTAVDDPQIAGRWHQLFEALEMDEEVALGEAPIAPPGLVPWTRKAHELVLHAEEHGMAGPMRHAIFDAYVRDGVDIGRIDQLVEVAVGLGLDRSSTRAVLDVDRFDALVAERRNSAISRGITTVPVVETNEERLAGFHDAALLRTFLGT